MLVMSCGVLRFRHNKMYIIIYGGCVDVGVNGWGGVGILQKH